MRAVFRKELVELALAAVLALALGIVVALTVQDEKQPAGALMAVACLGAVAVGVLQGLLDRRARSDEFLLHRPLSWARLHAVRTAAGLLCVAAVALLPALLTLVLPYREGVARATGGPFDPRPRPLERDFSIDGALGLVLLAAAFYAVVRLGASARHPAFAATFMAIAPFVLLVGMVRSGSLGAALALAAGVIVVGHVATLASLATPQEVR